MVCVTSRSLKPESVTEKVLGKVYGWGEGRATLNQQQSLRKRRFLSSPGTWLSGVQLPGLLGFPRGEEQAPGEQVELREEKGAKNESSPSPGLPYRREPVGPFFPSTF